MAEDAKLKQEAEAQKIEAARKEAARKLEEERKQQEAKQLEAERLKVVDFLNLFCFTFNLVFHLW